MENNDKLIAKIDLTNELLFRLCVGQRLLSSKECLAIRGLIPRMIDYPCTLCQANCIDGSEKFILP